VYNVQSGLGLVREAVFPRTAFGTLVFAGLFTWEK
jgi:hypothetical protein